MADNGSGRGISDLRYAPTSAKLNAVSGQDIAQAQADVAKLQGTGTGKTRLEPISGKPPTKLGSKNALDVIGDALGKDVSDQVKDNVRKNLGHEGEVRRGEDGNLYVQDTVTKKWYKVVETPAPAGGKTEEVDPADRLKTIDRALNLMGLHVEQGKTDVAWKKVQTATRRDPALIDAVATKMVQLKAPNAPPEQQAGMQKLFASFLKIAANEMPKYPDFDVFNAQVFDSAKAAYEKTMAKANAQGIEPGTAAYQKLFREGLEDLVNADYAKWGRENYPRTFKNDSVLEAHGLDDNETAKKDLINAVSTYSNDFLHVVWEKYAETSGHNDLVGAEVQAAFEAAGRKHGGTDKAPAFLTDGRVVGRNPKLLMDAYNLIKSGVNFNAVRTDDKLSGMHIKGYAKDVGTANPSSSLQDRNDGEWYMTNGQWPSNGGKYTGGSVPADHYYEWRSIWNRAAREYVPFGDLPMEAEALSHLPAEVQQTLRNYRPKELPPIEIPKPNVKPGAKPHVLAISEYPDPMAKTNNIMAAWAYSILMEPQEVILDHGYDMSMPAVTNAVTRSAKDHPSLSAAVSTNSGDSVDLPKEVMYLQELNMARQMDQWSAAGMTPDVFWGINENPADKTHTNHRKLVHLKGLNTIIYGTANLQGQSGKIVAEHVDVVQGDVPEMSRDAQRMQQRPLTEPVKRSDLPADTKPSQSELMLKWME